MPKSRRQILFTVAGVALAGTSAVLGFVCAYENFAHDTTGDRIVLGLNCALLTTSILLVLPIINLWMDRAPPDQPLPEGEVRPGSPRPPLPPPGPMDHAGRDVTGLERPASGGEGDGATTWQGTRRRKGMQTSHA